MSNKNGKTFWDWAYENVDGCGCIIVIIILSTLVEGLIKAYFAYKRGGV